MVSKEPMPADEENILVFGDGLMAKIWSVRRIITKEKDAWEFAFKPTPWLKWFHEINDSEYTAGNLIVCEYASEFVHPVQVHPRYNAFILLCNMRGQSTDFVKLINQSILLENQNMKRQINALQTQIVAMNYTLIQFGKNPTSFIKNNILPLLAEFKKASFPEEKGPEQKPFQLEGEGEYASR